MLADQRKGGKFRLKEKQIQIPYSMFLDVYRLILLLDRDMLDTRTRELAERIEAQINVKIERNKRHATYTESKVGVTPEERETARHAYLDLVGIAESFRYSQEYAEQEKQ